MLLTDLVLFSGVVLLASTRLFVAIRPHRQKIRLNRLTV
jgi:hypothetical protein